MINKIFTRGIRGAISVENNDIEAIRQATLELLKEILHTNKVDTKDISHIIFTMTKDLNAAFPAKFARENLNFSQVPMMCYNELDVQNSMPMCLRVLMVVNSSKTQDQIKHIYLKEAKKLRPDVN